MAIIFLTLFALGFICHMVSRRFKNSIEKMDTQYTGDIIPNKEEEDWYHYERRIKYRIMKATWYFGIMFYAYLTLFALMLFIEWVS